MDHTNGYNILPINRSWNKEFTWETTRTLPKIQQKNTYHISIQKQTKFVQNAKQKQKTKNKIIIKIFIIFTRMKKPIK